MQKAVKSAHLSWDVGFKKPRPILLKCSLEFILILDVKKLVSTHEFFSENAIFRYDGEPYTPFGIECYHSIPNRALSNLVKMYLSTTKSKNTFSLDQHLKVDIFHNQSF